MKLRNTILFGLLALAAIGATQAITRVPAERLGKDFVIIGRLEHQLGETITIKGYKIRANVGDEFFVEEVNGQKKKWGLIRIPGTRSWKDETSATFKGREVAHIRFRDLGSVGPEAAARGRRSDCSLKLETGREAKLTSLRTLLIATMLVAVVLGVIIWTTK